MINVPPPSIVDLLAMVTEQLNQVFYFLIPIILLPLLLRMILLVLSMFAESSAPSGSSQDAPERLRARLPLDRPVRSVLCCQACGEPLEPNAEYCIGCGQRVAHTDETRLLDEVSLPRDR